MKPKKFYLFKRLMNFVGLSAIFVAVVITLFLTMIESLVVLVIGKIFSETGTISALDKIVGYINPQWVAIVDDLLLTFTILLLIMKVIFGIFAFYYYGIIVHKFKSKLSNSLFVNINKLLFNNQSDLDYDKVKLLISTELTQIANTVGFPLLILISEVLIFISLAILLFILAPLLAVYLGFSMVIAVTALSFSTKKYSAKISEARAMQEGNKLSLLTCLFNSYVDILLERKKEKFQSRFYQVTDRLAKIEAVQTGISAVPRYFIEAVGLILFITFYVSYEPTMATIFSAGAAGARMLPSINRVAQNIQLLNFGLPILTNYFDKIDEASSNNIVYSVSDISKNLPVDISHGKHTIILPAFKLCFGSEIAIQYSPKSLNRADRILLKGKSGSGKSNYVMALLGLHGVEHGLFDKLTDIFDKPSYVSQRSYLLDGSVRENLQFPSDEPYPSDDIQDACDITGISEVSSKYQMTTTQFLDSPLGSLKGALQLSGGELQRLYLARALIRAPDLLILDEATSALDSAASEMIFNRITKSFPSCTILLISHEKVDEKQFNQIWRFDT